MNDPLVQSFIDNYLHPDLATEVNRTLDICQDVYEQYDETPFIELFSIEQSISSEDLHDKFFSILIEKIDFIIKTHGFELAEGMQLKDKNEFVSALVALQDRDSFSDIIAYLESDADDHDKIAELLSSHSALSSDYFASIITNFNPMFITMVKVMAYDKEKGLSQPANIDKNLINHLKDFKEYLNGKKALGFTLVESNFPPNLPLKTYVSFVRDSLNDKTIQELAIDVFSLILISEDGLAKPQIVYKENSYLFFENIDMATKLETTILALIADFNKFLDTKGNKK